MLAVTCESERAGGRVRRVTIVGDMGFCSDRSTQILKDLGYNVVRHPSAAIEPLQLIAMHRGAAAIAGRLEHLLRPGAAAPLPEVRRDVPAAGIEGLTSSTLQFGVGAALWSSFIAALGGGAATLQATRETGIRFRYIGVRTDWTAALEAGRFLASAPLDGTNPLIAECILGHGDLYLITRVIKSQCFEVEAAGAGAEHAGLEARGVAPTLRVTRQTEQILRFEGEQAVVFGFQCFRVGLEDGRVTLAPAKAGSVAAAVDSGSPELLAPHGLLDLDRGPVQEL